MSRSRQDEGAAGARLRELGEALALGEIRLKARKSRELSAGDAENGLHFTPEQSGHANSETESLVR